MWRCDAGRRRRWLRATVVCLCFGVAMAFVVPIVLALVLPYRTLARGFVDYEAAYACARPDGQGSMYLITRQHPGFMFAHTVVPSGRVKPEELRVLSGNALELTPHSARTFLWPWLSAQAPLPKDGGTDWRAVMEFGWPLRSNWLGYRPTKQIALSPHTAFHAIECSDDQPAWWPRAIPLGLRWWSLLANAIMYAGVGAALLTLARFGSGKRHARGKA